MQRRGAGGEGSRKERWRWEDGGTSGRPWSSIELCYLWPQASHFSLCLLFHLQVCLVIAQGCRKANQHHRWERMLEKFKGLTLKWKGPCSSFLWGPPCWILGAPSGYVCEDPLCAFSHSPTHTEGPTEIQPSASSSYAKISPSLCRSHAKRIVLARPEGYVKHLSLRSIEFY